MPNYDVGYGKPPKKSRFKPGTSGNPKGRPKRKPAAISKIIRDALSAAVRYRANGRTKTATRHEVVLKTLIAQALKGDLTAAGLIPTVRAHILRFGEVGIDRLQIEDWLPDYRGQTAHQKTRELASASKLDPHLDPIGIKTSRSNR
jgi:hypothetical protein